MKKIFYPIFIIALVSCSENKTVQENESANKTDSVISAIETDTTQADGISSATSKENQVSFNGTLIVPPDRHACVSLPMNGIIKKVSLLAGSYVTKGTVLALVENLDFVTLQQNYLESVAQIEFLESEYRRQESLASADASSLKRLQESKAEYLSMKSKLDASAAQLSLLGVDIRLLKKNGIESHLKVIAPISGYVSNVQANLGKFIDTGSPICDIIDKNSILLRLIAYEKNLNAVRVGDKVEFRVNGMGNTVYTGELISIGQSVDDTNRSIELFAKVSDKNSTFRPGMYVTAKIRNNTTK